MIPAPPRNNAARVAALLLIVGLALGASGCGRRAPSKRRQTRARPPPRAQPPPRPIPRRPQRTIKKRRSRRRRRLSRSIRSCKARNCKVCAAMHHFAYRGGALHAEEVDLERIANEVGTPFYCYSSATIERHFKVFADAFADGPALVCYAMKANSNQAVLATLARLGRGNGRGLRGRAAPRPRRRRARRQDHFFRRRQDPRRDGAGARRRHPLLQRRIRAGAGDALRGRGGARADRAHRPSRQSGRRRAHSRQDLHRKSENKFGIPISHARDVYAAPATCPASP